MFLLILSWIGSLLFTIPNITLWQQPPDMFLKAFCYFLQIIQPSKIIVNGGDFIPKTKVLFVANHQVASLDILALFSSIYLSTGLYPRGLGDRLHFKVPFWNWFLFLCGAIPGTREICSQAMEAGLPILVFPGGREEVFKSSSDPKYVLKWKSRTGFVKLAAKHGYTIVPIGIIGLEDQISIVYDLPIDPILAIFGERKSDPATWPIMLPNSLQRQYCVIGPGISIGSIDTSNEQELIQTRDIVKSQLLTNLETAKTAQEKDPNRFILANIFQFKSR